MRKLILLALGDGFGDAGATAGACEPPAGYVADSTDCDDTDGAVHPQTTWYADADGDGHGDPATREVACAPGSGWVLAGDDCDDTDADLTLDCGGDATEVKPAGCGCASAGPPSGWLWLLGLLALRRRHGRARLTTSMAPS